MVTFKCSSWLCKLQGKAEIYARAGQISATLRQFRAGSSSSSSGSRKVRMALNECRIVFVTKTFAHFLQHCWGSTGQQGQAASRSEPVDISFCFIILLLLHFYIIGGNFSAILGTTYGAKSELEGGQSRPGDLLVPTSYYTEGGSRRPCEKFRLGSSCCCCCCPAHRGKLQQQKKQ